MTKETEDIVADANRLVYESEIDYFYALMIEAEAARNRAEGCGCLSCRKVAKRMSEVEYEEAWRMNYGEDHEETFITNMALKRVGKNGNKNQTK